MFPPITFKNSCFNIADNMANVCKRWALQGGSKLEAVYPKTAEFGVPHWVFARTTYGFSASGMLVCSYSEAGCQHLAQIDTQTLQPVSVVPLPYCTVNNLRVRDSLLLWRREGIFVVFEAKGDT